MKNKMLIKTLSLFLVTTLLQVSGISSKLLNGSGIVQVNAATKSYAEIEKHIMASVEIQGDMIDGQTLTAVVKDPNGKDITQYCSFMWFLPNTPTTDYKTMLASTKHYIHELEDSKIILEKENIGNYIGIIVVGDYVDPNAPAGSTQLATKVLSTNSKVEANPLNHWQKEFKYYKGDESTEWYYLNDDGSKFKGWKEIGGSWYYFNTKRNGEMETYWENINGSWYYFQPGSGRMLTGWIKYKSWKEKEYKYYYLYNNGVMATNTTIDGHYLDASGGTTDIIDKSLVKN